MFTNGVYFIRTANRFRIGPSLFDDTTKIAHGNEFWP